ncbi:MAG: hypothetical protein ABI689_07310 [Thermoanaerobaculia bacterium]
MNYRTSAAFLFTLAIASVAAAQTNPAAKPGDSTIMDNTMQVTGSVISTDANRLVVKNDNGQEMVFIITDKQVNIAQFRVGDRVTASYVTLAGTGAVVSKVVSAPALVTTTSTQYATPPAETKVTTTTTAPYPAAAPAPAVTTTKTTVAPVAADSYDTSNSKSTRVLPATASPMPLVALLGLLGAGGAATIRRFRLS